MRLLQRAAAAVNNGKNHDPHHHILRPGSPDKVRAKAVKGQSDDGKGSRLYHGYRMQKRSDRVGATPAWGSQELKGQTAAFTPKPQKAMQYMSSSMDLLSPPVTEASRTPPKVKLMVVP